MADHGRTDVLASVAARVRACTACPLSASRTQAVPGVGPATARVMFVGEGPGYHEDRLGEPFVGAAGKLLGDLLETAGLRRADVFITNIVKCRPPGNRDPEASEIEACRGYLDEQIELIDPAVIVTLGRFALEHFEPGARISRVHGQPRMLAGRMFLPMLHPAAALHRPQWRPELDADFAALRRVLASAEGDSAPQGEETATAKPPQGSPADETAQQLTLF